MVMPLIAPLLRSWDASTSLRVDRFVANSNHVAARIAKYYRRTASVVYPPVVVDDFAPSSNVGDFYLCAGQIVPYKRIDLAVRAFNRLGKPLVIIGGGKEKEIEELKRIAGPNIKFLGKVSFSELKKHLATCKALVFPGEEDFGMVPVETMASGRPVIAYASGGALETVVHGKTGILFRDQSEQSLCDAVDSFEAAQHLFDPTEIRSHAAAFGAQRFRQAMEAIIEAELSQRRETQLDFGIPQPSSRYANGRPAMPVH
jgi:glycosyltransferase involved in cell wall biosynthesis